MQTGKRPQSILKRDWYPTLLRRFLTSRTRKIKEATQLGNENDIARTYRRDSTTKKKRTSKDREGGQDGKDRVCTTTQICSRIHIQKTACHLTACVTCAGAEGGTPSTEKKAKARKPPENAQTPQRQVHAVLGGAYVTRDIIA